MAPLLKQQNSGTSAGLGTSSDGYIATRTIATTANVASGNLLFLVVNLSGANPNLTAVTDSQSNTWTKWTAASIPSTGTGADLAIEVWTATAGSSAALTITMNAGSAVQWGVNIREYTGVAPSSFKVTAATAFDANYVQSHAVGTTALAGNGDLVITGIDVSHDNEIFATGGGYTNMATMSAVTGLQYLSAAVQDRLATAAGVQSATFGTANYDKGLLFIAVLKAHITSAPPPPTDLTITPGETSAAMNWSASPGADSYTVGRSTSPSGTFTTVQSGITSTTYTNTGLTTGTTYYFRVSATNSVGTSTPTTFPAVTPAVPPAAPFGDWYPNGVQPSLNATSMRQTFRSKVDAWFSYVLTSENNPGTPIPANPRLPGPVKRIKAPEQGFYPDNNSRNGTVSEGMGFAALDCAWLSNPALAAGVYWSSAKATFDALYRYYDSNKNSRGLMNWHIFASGAVGDYNGATDGDCDMAEALRAMSALHGDAGAINYGAEADALMKAIEDWEVVPETGYAYPNLLTAGDGWGFNFDIYMPDYTRMGYFHEWSIWLRKRGRVARADRWDRILAANYNHMQFYVDSTTYTAGVPDRQTRSHTTLDGDYNNQITYNSLRLGFGWMVDYLWHGTAADPRAKQFMDKIANRAKAVFTTGGNVKAPNYSPNLSSYQGYSNIAGWAYFGSTALGLSGNQTFATELFNAIAGSPEYTSSYFGGGVGCYALGVMSGAAQAFTSAGTTDPENPADPSDPPAENPAVANCLMSWWNGSSWIQLLPATTVS